MKIALKTIKPKRKTHKTTITLKITNTHRERKKKQTNEILFVQKKSQPATKKYWLKYQIIPHNQPKPKQ